MPEIQCLCRDICIPSSLFFNSIGFLFLQLEKTDCPKHARLSFSPLYLWRFKRLLDLTIFTAVSRGLPTSIFRVVLVQDIFLQILSPHRLISYLKTHVLFHFLNFISCVRSPYYRGDKSVHCLPQELHHHQKFAALLSSGRRHIFIVAVLPIISCVAVVKAMHTASVACPTSPLNSDYIPVTEERNL
jgi:hypothetical protein